MLLRKARLTAYAYGCKSKGMSSAQSAAHRAATIRLEINHLAAELSHLVGDYEDSDRRDAGLRGAIRQQKLAIRTREFELTALAQEVA